MPATTLPRLAQFYIKIDGTPLEPAIMQDLRSVEVDDTLNVPAMFSFELIDSELAWLDDNNFSIGKGVTIAVKDGSSETEILEGEVTAIEPHLDMEMHRLVVRGYDYSHRLHKGRLTQTFVNSTDGDIFKKIAGLVGMTARIGPTSAVHEYVMQDNETNWEFASARALRLGYIIAGNSGKELTIDSVENIASETPIELKWADHLLAFNPRYTAADYANKVTVRSWSAKEKSAVVGTATSGFRASTAGFPGAAADGRAGFSIEAVRTIVDVPVLTQSEAEAVAKAFANQAASSDLQADATIYGDPRIRAGMKVKISGVGRRFTGEYLVTRAQHVFDLESGYMTHLEVTGASGDSMLSVLSAGAGQGDRNELSFARSLVIAIVTDNRDPEDMFRVKVKFPWLSDEHASDWARIATPMTGNGRGFMFLPEVDDEVLVAFEQGDVHRPIIVGALWNGRDAPPLAQSAYTSSGKVEKRMIKTRAGHVINLIDKDGEEAIEIIDKKEANKILISSKDDLITVEATKKVLVKAQEIELKATDKITLDAKDIILKATNIQADAKADIKATANVNVQLKGTAGFKAEGATVEVKGQGQGTVDGGGMLNLKGGMVKIN